MKTRTVAMSVVAAFIVGLCSGGLIFYRSGTQDGYPEMMKHVEKVFHGSEDEALEAFEELVATGTQALDQLVTVYAKGPMMPSVTYERKKWITEHLETSGYASLIVASIGLSAVTDEDERVRLDSTEALIRFRDNVWMPTIKSIEGFPESNEKVADRKRQLVEGITPHSAGDDDDP